MLLSTMSFGEGRKPSTDSKKSSSSDAVEGAPAKYSFQFCSSDSGCSQRRRQKL